MRKVVLGALVGMVSAIAVCGVFPCRVEALAQRGSPSVSRGSGGDIIALSETVDGKYQQLTVIDSRSRVMSVYHIDLASGKIALCSVRNFHWDLQMLEFNGTKPLPREVQSMLEQR